MKSFKDPGRVTGFRYIDYAQMENPKTLIKTQYFRYAFSI